MQLKSYRTEKNKLNKTELEGHLGISREEVCQILEEGNSSCSLEKMIEISLKIDKFPIFNFEDKEK